ncbi:MAG: PilN domain-containing protein, partial [Armatimonadetes bacterium]|nr:PilN domain-containing protein [Armatimonadota bacterium]
DPWQGSGQGLAFDGQAAAFAVATGLAMHSEAALKVDLRPREPATERRRETTLAGVALVVVMLALVGSVLFGVSRYRQRQDQARLVAQQVQRAERDLAALGGEDPAFLEQLATQAREARAERDWLNFLRDLSLQLPANLSLEELTADRARPVVLRGQARSNAAIAQAMDVLNGLGHFEAARLDYANADRIGDELVYNFQITCPWKEPTRAAKETG